jgi:hypothetical protein
MLSVGWLVFAVVLAIILTGWVTFTVTRLDRLHARVDAAQAALDAQLVRRSAALLHAVEVAGPLEPQRATRYERAASGALNADPDGREAAENEVGRVIAELAADVPRVGGAEGLELHEACVRVTIARRFYNDAVRDTRTLRARRMPRFLHLAGHRDLPQFFDIDDAVEFPAPVAPPPTDSGEPQPMLTTDPYRATAPGQEDSS